MKKHNKVVAMSALAALVLFSASCKDEPLGFTAYGRSHGRISVWFAEDNSELCFTEPYSQAAFAARTILPHSDFDSYRFIFTKEGESAGTELIPDNNGCFILEVGNYTVELQAFIGEGSSAALVAAGVSQPFTVYPGDNDPVVVYLSPVVSVAQGSFTYTITYPTGAAALITLQQWPDMRDIPLTHAALSTGSGVTETLDLDAASYLLTVLVSKNGLYAGTTEAVHVYQLLTTTYTKHFNDADFIAPPPTTEPDLPTDPEPPLNSQIKIVHYWVDQHDNLVATSGATSVTPGETLAITAQGAPQSGEGYTVQQWHLNGVNTGQSGNTYYFASQTTGNHTISMFVEKDDKLYNTNIVITVKAEAAPPVTVTRTVTIDMFDSGLNGWGGSGALRINVNGTDIDTVKVSTNHPDNNPPGQRISNKYTFSVTTGDIVKLYWVVGTFQGENSFIVYYTDTPPIPEFNAADSSLNWNGSNALVYELLGAMSTITGGTLLGSFTVD